MADIAVSYLRYCLCSQFITPCPTHDDPRVPLATITVCSPGCSIQKVCNLDVRRYLLSPAWMQSLLEQTGVMKLVQGLLARFCCQDDDDDQGLIVGDFVRQPKYRATRRSTKASARMSAFSNTAYRSWAAAAPKASPRTLLLGAMGARDPSGKPVASAEALRDPEQYLAADRLIRPLMEAFIPEDLARVLRPLASQETSAGAEAPSATSEELRNEVESLRRAVAEQQARIDELLKRLG
jgi:hypothetical protein